MKRSRKLWSVSSFCGLESNHPGSVPGFKALVLIVFSLFSVLIHAQQNAVFHTGLEAKYARFSVSPDGQLLVFSTNRLAHGLRLLNLVNGKITVLHEKSGRALGYPDWSPDGKRLALISTAVQENNYILDDTEIVVVDLDTGQQQEVELSDGVKFFPFFSHDGTTLYYFKGKKRESGKTPASRYDLFAVELGGSKNTRLTNEEFYQAAKGDDAQDSVLFSATPNFEKRFKDTLGVESRNALFLYGKATYSVSIILVDQSGGIFDFSSAQRDKVGNLYFIAAKARPGGGDYSWHLIRTTAEGKQAEILTDLLISMEFDIAKNTGEIFVSDKVGKELVFRRLSTPGTHRK